VLLFRVCLLNKPLGALVMVLLTRYRCSVSFSPPLISMQLLEVVIFSLFLCIRLVFRGFFSHGEILFSCVEARDLEILVCLALSFRRNLSDKRSLFWSWKSIGLLLFLLWRVFSFSPFAVCGVTKKSKLLEAIVLARIQNFCSDSV
jgi:hypothetical protein